SASTPQTHLQPSPLPPLLKPTHRNHLLPIHTTPAPKMVFLSDLQMDMIHAALYSGQQIALPGVLYSPTEGNLSTSSPRYQDWPAWSAFVRNLVSALDMGKSLPTSAEQSGSAYHDANRTLKEIMAQNCSPTAVAEIEAFSARAAEEVEVVGGATHFWKCAELWAASREGEVTA
ncbi:hypothetical protein EJ06DRAFT_216578, partial [Trichodelitschia bisporula]